MLHIQLIARHCHGVSDSTHTLTAKSCLYNNKRIYNKVCPENIEIILGLQFLGADSLTGVKIVICFEV